MSNNSEWKKFYDDKLLWEEIEKDVKRTRQEVAFFHMAIDPTKNTEVDRLMKQAATRKHELSKEEVENYIESHSDALARILFIYAKLN